LFALSLSPGTLREADLPLLSSFHTLTCHSARLYHFGMALDLQGILILMTTATVPLIYYSFPCSPVLRNVYFLATAVLAVTCSVAATTNVFGAPHLGRARAALFASFGIVSFAAPIVHGVLRYGLDEQSQRTGLPWVLATASANGLGFAAYTMRVSSSRFWICWNCIVSYCTGA
jgi:adiponectin receptor